MWEDFQSPSVCLGWLLVVNRLVVIPAQCGEYVTHRISLSLVDSHLTIRLWHVSVRAISRLPDSEALNCTG